LKNIRQEIKKMNNSESFLPAIQATVCIVTGWTANKRAAKKDGKGANRCLLQKNKTSSAQTQCSKTFVR